MQSATSRRGEQFPDEFSLRQRLAAAQRQPAAGPHVEPAVFLDRSDHVIDARELARNLQSPGGTHVGAFTAVVTAFPIDLDLPIRISADGARPTRREAPIALARADAAGAGVGELGRIGLTFGVRTPRARQGTAFEEDERSYPIAVMQRELLDVEDQTARPVTH